ncbi:hypothetical protein AB0N14_07970 [Streptomyces sp. NPDC051104]|uniref:hypothetical protein n=1 Tax=Streptomyces sp. NPDC051104 TaxID=3155044 RepID=UPI00343EB761
MEPHRAPQRHGKREERLNASALLLGTLAYLALGMALLTGIGCTPGDILGDGDEDADDIDCNRHVLVGLAILWVALLVLWPLAAVAGGLIAFGNAARHMHWFVHRLLYHPWMDCTDDDGWYGSDICGRRPLAWVIRR